MTQYAWLIYSLLTVCLAGGVPVLMKAGSKKTDACLACGITGGILMAADWFFVYQRKIPVAGIWQGSQSLYLVLAGAAVGAAWICFFKALSLGDVIRCTPLLSLNKAAMLLLGAYLISKRAVTGREWLAVALVVAGIVLLLWEKPGKKGATAYLWLLYAILAAAFLVLYQVICWYGISGVDSGLLSAVVHTVMFVMSWIVVLVMHRQKQFYYVTFTSGLLLCLAGIAYEGALLVLSKGQAFAGAELISQIAKAEYVMTVVWACVFLRERMGKLAFFGLILFTAGVLML